MVFIVGPTAVGKTEVGFLLAKALRGEIVSCDAMQVYKGLDIASNKPDPKTLRQIPHHLIGCVPLSRDFDVAQFQKKARSTIRKIQAQGRTPIVVGGSGLYVQVLLDGIFAQGPQDLPRREALQKEAQSTGVGPLYERLRQLDPASAERIHPHDLRRIVRALEVALAGGQPLSELQKQRRGLWSEQEILIFALDRDRGSLYERINRRVDEMFAKGLVDEVKDLEGKAVSRTAGKMIGVPEVRSYLRGDVSLQEAKDLLKRNTRRYAKRQMTWFRKDKRLIWIDLSSDRQAADIVRELIKSYIPKD